MRLSAISLVMLLLLAALVPIGSSQKVQQIPISEGQCGLESYSEMVQIAFEREAQIETDITNSESLEGDWLAVISGACKEDSNLAPYVSNILGADLEMPIEIDENNYYYKGANRKTTNVFIEKNLNLENLKLSTGIMMNIDSEFGNEYFPGLDILYNNIINVQIYEIDYSTSYDVLEKSKKITFYASEKSELIFKSLKKK